MDFFSQILRIFASENASKGSDIFFKVMKSISKCVWVFMGFGRGRAEPSSLTKTFCFLLPSYFYLFKLRCGANCFSADYFYEDKNGLDWLWQVFDQEKHFFDNWYYKLGYNGKKLLWLW